MLVSQTNNAAQLSTISAPQSFPAIEDRAAQIPATGVRLPQKAVQPVSNGAVDISALKTAADQVNQVVRQMASSLQFSVDEDTGVNVVKVMDTETNEVIRQIPSQEVLAIAKALDRLQGLLLKEKA